MLSHQQFSIIYVKDLLLAGHRSRKVETENICKNMIMIYLSTLNRPQSSDSVCNSLISYGKHVQTIDKKKKLKKKLYSLYVHEFVLL